MKEFIDLQIGDEISFQKINPMKKGILLNKRYCIKDIFNIWDDWKCIAFIGENKRRVVLRNNLYRFVIMSSTKLMVNIIIVQGSVGVFR